jgi:hypothetical protein
VRAAAFGFALRCSRRLLQRPEPAPREKALTGSLQFIR